MWRTREANAPNGIQRLSIVTKQIICLFMGWFCVCVCVENLHHFLHFKFFFYYIVRKKKSKRISLKMESKTHFHPHHLFVQSFALFRWWLCRSWRHCYCGCLCDILALFSVAPVALSFFFEFYFVWCGEWQRWCGWAIMEIKHESFRHENQFVVVVVFALLDELRSSRTRAID